MEDRGRKGIVICTTPRSGSNLLCEAMAATGQLGNPQEYFNAPGRRRYGMRDYPQDPRDQVAFVLHKTASPNRVYALKTFFGQSEKVLRRIDWTRALPGLTYVYLTRDDLVGQAISLVLSRQTGQYRSTDAPGRAPVFDAKHIGRTVVELAADNARWEVFFARRGVEPLRLRYEEASARLSDTVAEIAGFAGIAVDPIPDWRPSLARQRGDLNSDWRDRYLAWAARQRPWWRWWGN